MLIKILSSDKVQVLDLPPCQVEEGENGKLAAKTVKGPHLAVKAGDIIHFKNAYYTARYFARQIAQVLQ